MKSKLLIPVLSLIAGVGLFHRASRASLISDVEATASGTTGTLDQNPIITEILSQPGTFNGKTYTNWSFLVNDGSGSMDIFGKLPTGSTYTPTVGDAITAAGTYSPFDQIPELETLTAISQVSSGNAPPAPLSVTIPDINLGTLPLSIAGYYVSLDNVTLSGNTGTFGVANLTFTMTDASNNSMTAFYWPTSYSVANANLFGTAIPTGPVNVTGFVDSFSGAAEFVPITITAAVPEPASLAALTLGAAGLLLRRRRSTQR